MDTFCLDANVFIEAKNGPYGFDIVPVSWKWLDEMAGKGTIYSPTSVYDELAVGSDELATWVKGRKSSPLFMEPNEAIQSTFEDVAAHVATSYPSEYAELFLDGADPWVVAYAKTNTSFVVTREKFLSGQPRKVKIPNVCKYFNVQFLDTFELLRKKGAQFRWKMSI